MTTEDLSVVKAIATKLSRGVPVCPVTCGQKTRMLEKSFRRMCAKHRDHPDGYCRDVCQGKNLPANLEFFTIGQMEEEGMGVQWKDGQCELCKVKKSVRTNNGKVACASCEPVWRYIANRPDLVFEMLREKLGDGWFVEKLGVPVEAVSSVAVPSVDPLELELKKKDDEIEVLKSDNTKINALLTDSTNYVLLLKEEKDALEQKLAKAAKESCDLCAGRDRSLQRDTIVLDLALRVLSGEVGGLSADHLQALR